MEQENKEQNKEQQLKENMNLFSCFFQASVWQSETFIHEFSKDAKRRINLFKQHAYKMLDAIYKNIKKDKEAQEYFDKQTAFLMDVSYEAIKIENEENQEEVLEILRRYNSGELKINREQDG